MCFATLDWFWCQWMYIPIWRHVCKSPSVIKTTVNNICSGFCCCCKQPQQPRPTTTTTTATKKKYRAPFLCLERNLGRRSRFFSLSSFPFAKCKTMQLYCAHCCSVFCATTFYCVICAHDTLFERMVKPYHRGNCACWCNERQVK